MPAYMAPQKNFYRTFRICLACTASTGFAAGGAGGVFLLASLQLCQNKTIGLATKTEE